LLGGKISAESSLGKGSVFSFTIQAPECVDAKVSDEPIPSRVVSIKNSARPRILVVDDKSINRDILVNMLVPIGFVVEQAEDGEKALSLLRTAFFDIVLLDYVMPGVSGRELVDALRASAGQSRLRIILMTGSLLENQQLDIQALGVDALLAKPVLERSLLSEIKRLACIDYNCSDDEEKNSGVFCSDEEAKRRLSTISPGLFETLRDSITSGDLEDVKSIAQEIARGDERLGKTLADWAGGIQMDRLLRLIK
jgi:CheY-like chemotaxis protein